MRSLASRAYPTAMAFALPGPPQLGPSLVLLATAAPWPTLRATCATSSAGPAEARDYLGSNSSTVVLPTQPAPVL